MNWLRSIDLRLRAAAGSAHWAEEVRSDLRFALRYFARQPLTTATIVVVLALGIGANSALFSLIQAYTVRPAPAVPKDDSHARIYGLMQSSRDAPWQLRSFTHTELDGLAAHTETFAAVAGWLTHDVVLDPADSSGARGLSAEFVTPNFFAALAVPLVAGPGFARQDPGTPDHAAVLSFALAEALYDAPAIAVGRRILVNDVAIRIVGVAPPRFQGAIPGGERPALWLPLSARADVARTSPRWLMQDPALSLFARLAPTVTREQASAIAREVALRAMPDSVARAGAVHSTSVRGMRSAPPVARPGNRVLVFTTISVLGVLIMLVACTNVSSLLVAAAVGRRHEITVRLALGASRARLLRQLLTESALLSLAGGTAGLMLYWWIASVLASRAADLNVELAPDLATVAFTMTFALGTGLLFGLSPALHALRGDFGTALRDSGTGGTRRSRLQRIFVVAQLVFSLPLLLMLAGMLTTTLAEQRLIPSAESDRIIVTVFRPLMRSGAPGQRQEVVDALAPRILERTGVAAVVPDAATIAVRDLVMPDSAGRIRVQVEGTAPGYFGLLDVPIVLGRDVSLADSATTEQRVVIGSDLARQLFGDANPIGKTVASLDWREGARDSVSMLVVGVFDATRATTRGSDTRVYTSHGNRWRGDALLIRTRGPARALVPSLRGFIRAEAPALPLSRIETLSDINERDRKASLAFAGAFGSVGALALLLASLGLYSVVSLSVGQRRREIGIRIAVGANPLRVARMFFASGLRLAALGLVLGLPPSIVGLRVVLAQESVPAEVNLWLVGLGVAAVMLVVASVASWIPARRATEVDPALTLRVD